MSSPDQPVPPAPSGPSDTPSDHCRWGLYVIIDSQAASGRPHTELARAALAGGARVLQLRDKTAPFEDIIPIAAEIRELTRAAGATFIINDNPYLAREVDADGVHVGQHDFPADLARDIVGPGKIIGLSTHSRQQAMDSRKYGVDYIGVGPVYQTSTVESEWPVVGPEMIHWVKSVLTIPVVAIGGITPERIPDVVKAGADNVAVISALMSVEDIESRTRDLREMIDRARATTGNGTIT